MLPGVCVVFTFQHLGGKPSREGVQTHTHKTHKALSPFQTAGTLLHHLHADMKAMWLGTGRHQRSSTSNEAALMYAATIQIRCKHAQPEPATSVVGTFTRRLNGSSLRFCFSLLLLSCFGWFYVSSSHCKLNSPQSDASAKWNRLLFTFIVSLNNVYQSCVVCFERSALWRAKSGIFLCCNISCCYC